MKSELEKLEGKVMVAESIEATWVVSCSRGHSYLRPTDQGTSKGNTELQYVRTSFIMFRCIESKI